MARVTEAAMKRKRRRGRVKRAELMAAYRENPRYCKECGSRIPFRKRVNIFCDSSCDASYNNKRRASIPSECASSTCCTITRLASSTYCSVSCQHNEKANKAFNFWKKYPGKVKKLTRAIRRFIWNKYKNKCGKCGWCKKNPVTKKVPLEIDHIDGDRQHNREKNLILLCPNCHALTPTFKGLNVGNKKVARRRKREALNK